MDSFEFGEEITYAVDDNRLLNASDCFYPMESI
jgi:hypothetical protein